ncbi:MAG: hypothetical protein KDC45_04310 [Bacteroidetes bacterium]|nr:hypothetical protein [Bacteroidota bacterium]
MKRLQFLGISMLVGGLLMGCRRGETQTLQWNAKDNTAIHDYWFSGKAELSSYTLEQARYGEMRSGDAVLIFVTEDFLTDKQVKLEDYSKGKEGSVPILKLNLMKTFNTGIYPYTLMQSVFSPMNLMEYPHALKATSTVLEWCGQAYAQVNQEDKGFKITQHSYFEKEADKTYAVEKTWLEDEVWTRIRMAPETLPTGDINMIPGMLAARLRHIPLAVETAMATLKETSDGSAVYSLRYDKSDRDLSIRFEKLFPHRILSWEETYVDGWGDKAKRLTTKATLKKTIKSEYWRQNSNKDAGIRKELGLE